MKTKSLVRICIAAIAVVFLSALTFTKLLPWLEFRNYQPQNGDLLFQSLQINDLVIAIEGITESPYSHCGIVAEREGSWYVIEAIGPVKYTPLYEWVQRGREESFTVHRLKDQKHVDTMINEAESFLGRPYDVRYRLDDEKIYCSELIYKAYEKAAGIKLGKLKKLGEMPWENYKKTIMKYEQGPPPLERDMITPANLSRSSELQQVYKQGFD